MKRNLKKIFFIALKFLLGILACFVIAFVALTIFLTITEYKPAKTEKLAILSEEKAKTRISKDRVIRIATWNIGYGALGAKQDFFMDDGSMVRPKTKAEVVENVDGIVSTLKGISADIILLQESDRYAKRSYYINQQEAVAQSENMAYAHAFNFKCEYVPYPIPAVGKVASGLASYSSFKMNEAYREALPGTFKWPVSLAHLKRCLLVSRFPLDSGKSLVLVNLHLEAFDSGPGRLAQTKTLMTLLKTEYKKGNYVIAGGDFNQTFPNNRPKAFALQEGMWHPGVLEEKMLPKGWHYASDDSAPTCRATHTVYTEALQDEAIKAGWQYYLVDGFILSPNIEVKAIKTLDNDFLYSDHNPVYMDFILK